MNFIYSFYNICLISAYGFDRASTNKKFEILKEHRTINFCSKFELDLLNTFL